MSAVTEIKRPLRDLEYIQARHISRETLEEAVEELRKAAAISLVGISEVSACQKIAAHLLQDYL